MKTLFFLQTVHDGIITDVEWNYYPAILDQIWGLCKAIQKLKSPSKSLIACFIKPQARHGDAKSPHIVPFK